MKTWQNPGIPLILASQSPRRREILANMGLVFSVVSPAAIDEASFIDTHDLHASLSALALAKAESVAAANPASLVLGADTVVVKDDRALGKPRDRNEARAMLQSLSGGRHRVLTGVALVCEICDFTASVTVCTDVFFRRLTAGEIDGYLDLDEYTDKAGAYAIQGRAMVFIEKISGCYYNVVGLPVAETIGLFSAFSTRSGDRHE